MEDTLPSQSFTPVPPTSEAETSAGPTIPSAETTPQVAVSTPPPPQTPQPTTSPQNVITPPAEGRGPSKFSLFIGLLIFITLGIYAFVGYLYLQNSQLKKEAANTTQGQNQLAVASPTATPTPAISPEEIKIVNGSVAKVSSMGETKILINKADYPSTGITGFAKATVSPDNRKICFEAWPPAPEPSLYLTNIDGSAITEVSPNRKSCNWTPDSQKIIYLNHATDISPIDIFLYDIAKGEETNFTGGLTEEGFIRFYEILGLSSDGTKVECKYSETTVAAEGTTTEGNCEINLTTLKLKEI